jgi:hypothetical protein
VQKVGSVGRVCTLGKNGFAKQVIFGFSLSVTVTVKLHVVVLRHASVAVAVTVVTSLGKYVPGFWLYVITGLEQASLPVAVKLTIALQSPVAFGAVIFKGQLIDGATVSIIVIVLDCVDCLLHLSVNDHVSVYTVPQAIAVPVITPVTDPLILQPLNSPFV